MIHKNTRNTLEKYNLMDEIKKNKLIIIVSPRKYLEFSEIISNCKYIFTDGGGVQEESLIYKKPCVILRMESERKEGLKTGIQFLTKLNLKYSKENNKKN